MTRKITVTGVMAAFLCIIAPFAIQVGPIPITLATFGIYVAGALMGAGRGTVAVIVYLLLGMAGLPVFSGFGGGLQRIVGVTGGYLIGYIPCVFITGLIIGRFRNKIPVYFIAMLLGTAVLYATGTVWYIRQTGNSFGAALAVCVVPFLSGDSIKIIMASVLTYELNKRLRL